MSGVAKKLMGTTAAGGGFTAIEDVFSTYLYTGNGSTQTITNGIDLAGEGGLVWIKNRVDANSNTLVDTERGQIYSLFSDTTQAQQATGFIGSFNSDGFTVSSSSGFVNDIAPYASWTFRKAPRFFDVVTYTGDGVARTIAHNLGVAPGCIIVKATSSSGDWWVYHRSLGATQRITLNATSASAANVNPWNNTEPTEAEFSLSSGVAGNDSGTQYVAYLFAHDPLGPSGDGSDGLIACGSYTGTGAAGNFVDLGWEPQWLLVKTASSADNWWIIDTMRGLPTGGNDLILNPNTSSAEINAIGIANVDARGFYPEYPNFSGETYIYIAIRRGPMRAPESGTEVFHVEKNTTSSPTFTTGFPIDTYIYKATSATQDWFLQTRLTNSVLKTNLTNAEDTSFLPWDSNTEMVIGLGANYANYFFRRAPEFFDVVAYTGNDTPRTLPHNLGAAPEMIITKNRTGTGSNWWTYHSGLNVNGDDRPETDYVMLNDTQEARDFNVWNDTAPTDTVFSLGSFSGNNETGTNYIAYLFSTLAGISKVGSYTGNGSSQTIDCGFTTGARFILIKRTDSTGDWYVWDTARGIVAANDPHLSLNTTAAEVTTDDSIDPDSSGFIVNQVAATNINVSAASYIFYAVA